MNKRFKLYTQNAWHILTCDLKGASLMLAGQVNTDMLDRLKIGETEAQETPAGDLFLWERIA